MATAPPRKSGADTLSNFAYVDAKGVGHLPLSKNGKLDANHVRNALARFEQTDFASESAKAKARAKINAAAKRLGIKTEQARDREPADDFGPLVQIAINATDPATPPEWIELVPAGKFTGADGRGPYSNTAPEAVVVATKADMRQRGLTGGIPLDYDHATDFRERGPAPAAGWITDFKVEHGAIWGKVEWTPDGAAHIAAKHWKYISPVFLHTEDDKRVVTCILHAALTNDPNLHLTAVAAARRSNMKLPNGITRAMLSKALQAAEGAPLSEIAKTVEKAFPNLNRGQVAQLIEFIERLEGEPDDPERAEGGDGDEDEEHPEVTAREGHAGGCTSEACQGECMADETMALAHARALHGADGDPTEEELATARAFVTRHRRIEAAQRRTTLPTRKEPRTMATKDTEKLHTLIATQTTELNNLKAERARERATAAVAAAVKAFKLTPAQQEWGVEYAMRDPDGFQTFIDRQPVLIRSGVDLTKPPTQDTAKLTQLDLLEFAYNEVDRAIGSRRSC